MNPALEEQEIVERKKYSENPFKSDVIIYPKVVKHSGIDPQRVIKEVASGKEHSIKFAYNVVKDNEAFIKIYKENIKLMFDLSTSAMKLFWYCCLQLRPDNDIVNIHRDEFLKWAEYKNRKSYSDGLNELLDKNIIAQSDRTEWYFINHSLFFNGNRLKIETVYYKLGS